MVNMRLTNKLKLERMHAAVLLLLFAVVGVFILSRSLAAPNPNLPGDLNGDNQVTITDLSQLLARYGTTNSDADINRDGQVNVTDLSLLLANWGKSAASTAYSAEFWNVPAFADAQPPTVPTTSPNATRTDADINFNWAETEVPVAGITADYFVARWRASKTFEAGIYTFTATADDGVRVYVDDQLVIDQWKRQAPTTYTAEKTMTAGVHAVRVEFYEQVVGAQIVFSYAKNGSGTPNPSPTTSPSPTTPPTGSGPQPMIQFAKGNPFTTPIPANVPLLSAGEQSARRSELRFLSTVSGTGLEQAKYSGTLYQVYLNGDIKDSEGDFLCKGNIVRAASSIMGPGMNGAGWPTGPCLKPATGGEGHMYLWSPETGAYGEWYQPSIGSVINGGWGGYIPNTKVSQGTSSQPNPWWGAAAFGMSTGSVIVTEKEIRAAEAAYNRGDHANAYIPHILGYEAYRHTPNTWEYPASKTDDMGASVPSWGVGGDANRLGHGRGIIPMGGIWRIDPNVNVLSINGDGTPRGKMLAQIFARTLQRHGATMTDQTGSGIAFLAEEAPHQAKFNYQHSGSNSNAWMKSLLLQAIDSSWVQFINTGRNLEADTGGAAPAGAYRPPR